MESGINIYRFRYVAGLQSDSDTGFPCPSASAGFFRLIRRTDIRGFPMPICLHILIPHFHRSEVFFVCRKMSTGSRLSSDRTLMPLPMSGAAMITRKYRGSCSFIRPGGAYWLPPISQDCRNRKKAVLLRYSASISMRERAVPGQQKPLSTTQAVTGIQTTVSTRTTREICRRCSETMAERFWRY